MTSDPKEEPDKIGWSDKMPELLELVKNGSSEGKELAFKTLMELASYADEAVVPHKYAVEFMVKEDNGKAHPAFLGDLETSDEAEAAFKAAFPMNGSDPAIQVYGPRIVGVISPINGYPTDANHYPPKGGAKPTDLN